MFRCLTPNDELMIFRDCLSHKFISFPEQFHLKSTIKQNCQNLAKVTKVQHICIAAFFSEMYPW